MPGPDKSMGRVPDRRPCKIVLAHDSRFGPGSGSLNSSVIYVIPQRMADGGSMRLQHSTEVKGRPSRRIAALGVIALMASLAACSSGPKGTVVNLYGGASGTGFDKIIADCNQQAAGRYTIVGNLLPSDADGQRDQFVRRLAAHDSGLDLLGMDVTWTAEFAEAGWIRELTGDQKTQATANTLQPPVKTATWKDKLYGIPRTTNVQLLWYRKSLV